MFVLSSGMAGVRDNPPAPEMGQSGRCEEEDIDDAVIFYNEEGMEEIGDDEPQVRPEKRGRDEENDKGDFTTVTYEKKLKKEKIQIYISHKDKLPKQFSLAKLLKEHNIVEITFIKYITPYKIRIDFEYEQHARNLLSNQKLLDKGWNIQKATEVNSSYGVIRDVDLDLSDEDIVKSITCTESIVLSSAVRLKRRDSNGEWVPSESVRLCFKGPCLPHYVSVEGLRIKVDRFIFPVSQCSRCWKLGHTTKRCPTNKISCPKCGDNHVNCDIKKFKCVNCKGNHMALVKSCPEYLKEKKIREIMAEFNCMYSKARAIYELRTPKPKINILTNNNSLPTFTHKPVTERNPDSDYDRMTCESNPSVHQLSPVLRYRKIKPTYANILKEGSKKETHSKPRLNERQKKKQHKLKHNTPITSVSSTDSELSSPDSNEGHSERRKPGTKRVSFKELLSRLKEIIFLRSDSIQEKIKSVIKYCVEWLILVVVDNISDWSALKSILQVING